MAQKTLAATVMTPVRNGYSSEPSGYDVGGPGSGSNYNNSIYMTFPAFGLPAGSTISGASLSYTMTDYDWSDAVTIYLCACVSAGTPSNQAGLTGTADGTSVAKGALVSTFAAMNTAKEMLATGKYYLKMYCANGTNRKKFSSTAAKLTIDYTPPDAPKAPPSVSMSPDTFEGALTVSWTKGSDGTNNPITGYEVAYQTSSDGTSWGAETVASAAAAATNYAIPVATISGWARGLYVRARVGSKSAYTSTVYSGYGTPVRKNSAPNAPTNVSVTKTCYAPGEAIRITFNNAGDADGNLKGFEAAITDNDTVLSSHNDSTATHVDISTATGAWTPGMSYQLSVRARDTLGAFSAWVTAPPVMVGLPMFVQPTPGGGFKRVVQMKVYVPDAGFKTVKSMRIAAAQGAINKTVF